MFFDSISDTLKERIDDNQGYRAQRPPHLAARTTTSRRTAATWSTPAPASCYTDDQDDRVRFRARPQIHEGPRLIDSGALPADTYTTGNVELAIVWGPFTVQSEAFLSQRQSRPAADRATCRRRVRSRAATS